MGAAWGRAASRQVFGACPAYQQGGERVAILVGAKGGIQHCHAPPELVQHARLEPRLQHDHQRLPVLAVCPLLAFLVGLVAAHTA